MLRINKNTRYHPYRRSRNNNNNNNNDENINEETNNPSLLNLLSSNLNNPFKQLFSQYDDTEVYVESNHIYFKTDVTPDSINKLCTILRHKITEFNTLRNNNLIENINSLKNNFYFKVHNYFPPPKDSFVINLASNNKIILKKNKRVFIKNIPPITIKVNCLLKNKRKLKIKKKLLIKKLKSLLNNF